MAEPASSPSSAPPRPDSFSPYEYAAAPDIIRAHQKDTYFQGLLTNQLADLHQRLLGSRSAHAWSAESRTAADLLYLGLTTLLGNRTLGEEYCDLVQVETRDSHNYAPGRAAPPFPRLPSMARRAAYISTSVLAPYLLARILPSLRAALRARLSRRLASLAKARRRSGSGSGSATDSDDKAATTSKLPTTEAKILHYLLTNLGALTSGAPIHAATLAVFYFTGAYYSLAKRLTGLRYVFTRTVAAPGSAAAGDRAGYEVLGVLLVAQLAVQAWLHARGILASGTGEDGGDEGIVREREWSSRGTVDVSLDENAYSSNNELLLEMGVPGGPDSSLGLARASALVDIPAVTHTPALAGGQRARFDLRDDAVMAWIRGRQQRKCTLCLEELKDPAATQCGHVFCWACIGDWLREKPECPLCRREAMAQHVLPLRVV